MTILIIIIIIIVIIIVNTIIITIIIIIIIITFIIFFMKSCLPVGLGDLRVQASPAYHVHPDNKIWYFHKRSILCHFFLFKASKWCYCFCLNPSDV